MDTPSTKFAENLAIPSITALTQAVVGCGIGLLLAGGMRRKVQKVTAITMLSVGLASTIPFAFDACFKRWNRPESDRGARKRLASIREDSGFSEDAEVY